MSHPSFEIITLFPNYFQSPLQESLLKKAIESKLISCKITNLRDFAPDPHKSVDDSPYGGGSGMVLRADVLASAVRSLKTSDSLVILTEPTGTKFTQKIAQKLSLKKKLIIICGRYEGVDQRFKDKYVDLELSIGDYVLNGGEAASLVLLETIARLVPGFLGKQTSLSEESFNETEGKILLEYPHYTRPEEFEGEKVPSVLLSGNHQEIALWRKEQAKLKTKKVRPDLLR